MPLINCPDCNQEISDTAPNCIHCGRPLENKPFVNIKAGTGNLNTLMFLGIISLLMIILGTLLPVASAPIVGGLDYIGNGDRDGIIIFGLGIVALLSFIIKRYKITILIDVIIIPVVTYSLYKLFG